MLRWFSSRSQRQFQRLDGYVFKAVALDRQLRGRASADIACSGRTDLMQAPRSAGRLRIEARWVCASAQRFVFVDRCTRADQRPMRSPERLAATTVSSRSVTRRVRTQDEVSRSRRCALRSISPTRDVDGAESCSMAVFGHISINCPRTRPPDAGEEAASWQSLHPVARL